MASFLLRTPGRMTQASGLKGRWILTTNLGEAGRRVLACRLLIPFLTRSRTQRVKKIGRAFKQAWVGP